MQLKLADAFFFTQDKSIASHNYFNCFYKSIGTIKTQKPEYQEGKETWLQPVDKSLKYMFILSHKSAVSQHPFLLNNGEHCLLRQMAYELAIWWPCTFSGHCHPLYFHRSCFCCSLLLFPPWAMFRSVSSQSISLCIYCPQAHQGSPIVGCSLPDPISLSLTHPLTCLLT